METYEQLHVLDRNKKVPVVFKTDVWDQSVKEYTLHGLKPATLYQVQAKIFFLTEHRQGNYEILFKLKENENGVLPPISSEKVDLITKQRYVTDFIRNELESAKMTMRPVSKNIPFVKSERALADFARADPGIQTLFNLEEELSEEEEPLRFIDDDDEDDDLWPTTN